MTTWALLCHLLADPVGTSRELAALLRRWPAKVRRIRCRDDEPTHPGANGAPDVQQEK